MRRKHRFAAKLRSGRLRFRKLSGKLRAKARPRRNRTPIVITETPVTMRSRFAWLCIVLMVLIIIAASLRHHPAHIVREFPHVETGNNPYMGTLDTETSMLLSLCFTRVELEETQGAYRFPALSAPENGKKYVVILDLGTEDASAEGKTAFVNAASSYFAEQGSCAYLQLEEAVSGVPDRVGDMYLLMPDSEGIYRTASDLADIEVWNGSPSAGKGGQMFGNHLSYLTDTWEDTFAGRLGYALGVRRAEWHESVRRGYGLTVLLEMDNAGVCPAYTPIRLQLCLLKDGEILLCQEQNAELDMLYSGEMEIPALLQIPYTMPKGEYTLFIRAVTADGTTVALTMPDETNGMYPLGSVTVK